MENSDSLEKRVSPLEECVEQQTADNSKMQLHAEKLAEFIAGLSAAHHE
ncbi:hypothetical protein [Pseudomonas sp. MWU16-30322]|nr:hypothetical protein [Pseudomonas sp. MWU16-30322]